MSHLPVVVSRSPQTGPVVVPLDGSSLAEVALPLGQILARRTGAELHLVHVLTPPPADAFHPERHLELQGHARTRSFAYLERWGGAADLRVRHKLLDGDEGVATAIARYAETEDASWIVLATHGAGGLSRWLLGSIADVLARTATAPLLLVRPWDGSGDVPSGEPVVARILVPLDESAEAESALAAASGLARSLGSTLDLVTVVPPGSGEDATRGEGLDYLEERAAALRDSGTPAETWRVAHDDVADGIHTAAVERGADLILMTTHGRGGLARAVIGSVADRLLRRGAANLALVRPGSEASEKAGIEPPEHGG